MRKRPNVCNISLLFCTPLYLAAILISCTASDKSKVLVTGDANAYVYPMDEIIVDGDLSDWPEEMARYEIKNAELGDQPKGNEDFQGHFKIGFNTDQNAMYIAMEIQDQSQVIDTTEYGNWNTQDGLELYLNQANDLSGSPVVQYSEYGTERLVFGAKDNWDNIEMKKRITDTGQTVEWKITLDEKILIGTSIGIDLVVIDKDEDDSFTWVSWGKGTQKVANPDRCGNILIVASKTALGQVKGQVNVSNLSSKYFPLTARIKQINNPRLWVRSSIDSLGNFSAQIPYGEYQMDIPSKLVEVDYRFKRIGPTDPIIFTLNKEGHEPLPVLTPKLMDNPFVLPGKGLLHNFGTEQEKQVDTYIKTYQEFYDIPGVSLALINDGKVVYHKTYGVQNTITKEAVKDQTLFEAASITKPVFAYVVLRLADRGIIDLDKPLFQYLPFEALEAYPEYKKITARHVLTHRSGLPNWGLEMVNEPGEKYGYSGEGFEYLKRAVIKITGKPIEQILDEELIDRFGLEHMKFSDSEALRKVVSAGHIGNQPTGWDIPQEAGMAFSMHTEALAFSKYALMLLEKKGLEPTTYNDLMTLHTPSNKEFWNHPDKQEGAGLGIFIRESDYGNTFYHGGNNGDFKCLFEVYSDLKMGYVCYTNSNTGSELTIDLWQLLVEGKK